MADPTYSNPIYSNPAPVSGDQSAHPLHVLVEFDYAIPSSLDTIIAFYDSGTSADRFIIWLRANGTLYMREYIGGAYTNNFFRGVGWLEATGHLRVDIAADGIVATLNGGEKVWTGIAPSVWSPLQMEIISLEPGVISNMEIYDLDRPDPVWGAGDLWRWGLKYHWIERFIIDIDAVCFFTPCAEETWASVPGEQTWFTITEDCCD